MTEHGQARRGTSASWQLIGRFVATGLMTAGLYFGLLVALVEFAQAGPGTAATIAYIIAILFNYFTQNIWTFSNEATVRRSGYRYVAVALALMIFNSAMMNGLAVRLGVNYLLSQVITAGFMVLISFVAQKTWVFSRPPP